MSASTVLAGRPTITARMARSVAVRCLLRRKGRIVGVVVLAVYAFTALFGTALLAPDALQPHPENAYLAPSLQHPLGTDNQGVGVFTDLVAGTSGVLEVGVGAAALITVIGAILGVAAGYLGGLVDALLMRLTDIVLTLPTFPLLLVIATIIKSADAWVLIVMLGAVGWGGLARSVRSIVLSLRHRAFVEAARGLQLRRRTIMGRVLLPNLASYISMHFLLAITAAIYAEVGLLFLGVAPFSTTNWGAMLNLAAGEGGAIYDPDTVMYLLSPILAILVLQGAIVAILGGIDEFFNPRLRETAA